MAWYLHDSGAFGHDFVAVQVIGNGSRIATCQREGRRFRTSVGNLIFITTPGSADDWKDDYK